MKVKELNDYIYSLAPKCLCMEGDNTGLLVGSPNVEVKKVYIALDITEDTVERAKTNGANVILSHHPLFFNGAKNVTSLSREGKAIMKAVRDNIAILSHHTNIDMCSCGLNFTFAKMVGGQGIALINEGALFSLDTTLDDLAKTIKEKFGTIKVAGEKDKKIKKAFVITGAGGRDCEILDFARANADVFITGEFKHNFLYDRENLALIDIPHYQSEIICLEVFEKMLKDIDVEVVKEEKIPPYIEY